jgi:hypothetical protein
MSLLKGLKFAPKCLLQISYLAKPRLPCFFQPIHFTILFLQLSLRITLNFRNLFQPAIKLNYLFI